ncbi:MAG: histidine kinase [Erysipelothrix sp.]|nr:histidine kinase [Erysipelothrix sp.]
MKKSNTTFEQKIKDTFIRYGRIPFLVMLMIVMSLFVLYYTYVSIYRPFQLNRNINRDLETSLKLIEDVDILGDHRYQNLYYLRSQIADDLQLIIFDKNQEIEMISQPSLEGSEYYRIYNRIVLSNVIENQWSMSIFKPFDTDHKYLIYSTYKDGYYIMVFMEDLHVLETLDDLKIMMALTDNFDNILFTSNQNLEGINGKLNTSTLDQYVYRKQQLPIGLYVHTFQNKDEVSMIVITMVIALILSYILMQGINKKSAKRIGSEFSHSIKQLHAAVKEMESGRMIHNVDLQTDDEFQALGEAFNVMNERLNKLIIRNENLLTLSKDAEIKQLEAQFNPHFLFNTLETIKYLVDEDPILASELIIKTTMLLRYSIDDKNNEIRFSQDLSYIKHYLDIHKLRLEDRFTYHLDVDDAVLNLTLPKLLIQPLIENSLKHGFIGQMNLHLSITVYVKENDLYIYIIDDGGGMDPEMVKDLNQYNYDSDKVVGFGIKSVIQRIKLKYGNSSQFKIHSNDKNTIIEIIIKEQANET